VNETFIYLVDDNAAHRSLAKRAIMKAKFPFSILEAGSLLDARRQFFSETTSRPKIELLIIDLNLSDGRGTDLVTELRASANYPALPIIVLSTSSLDADIRESYARGASCYLTKSDDIVVFGRELCAAAKFLLRC